MQLAALVILALLFAGCITRDAVPAPSIADSPPTLAPLTTSVAVETASNLIFVSARVNRTETVRLLLDTGASYTMLTTRTARRLGLLPEQAREWRGVVVAGGRELAIPLMAVRSLAVGHAELEGLHVGIYDAFPDLPALDGVLGGDFLKRFRFTVDHRRGHIELHPHAEATAGSR